MNTKTVVIGILLLTSACFLLPIDRRELPGTYVMNRGAARDTLIIQGNGRYRRIYVTPGKEVAVDSGAWTLGKLHGEQLVTFTSFPLRWRAEIDPSGWRRSPSRLPEDWAAPVERPITGPIQLVVDENIEWAYVKRSRKGG